MIRTAEEILKEKFPNAPHLDWFIPIRDCINEARIEAIKECAERVKGLHGKEFRRSQILSLIEQVK